jgi:hypothetical protein
MSANNHVFQVLVAPTDVAPVTTAGQTLTQLVAAGIGTMGVFSYDTGLSVSAATVVNERSIFIAIAVDTNGDGVADDVRFSAGTHIQKRGVTAYTLRCYSPERPNIVDITDFTDVKCDSDYAFKVEFRGNTQAYMNYGFNQFAKTFAVRTGCCGAGCDCPSGDCNQLAQLLVDAVNADTDGILLANYLDYTTTPGSPVVVDADDVAQWIIDNPGDCLGVRLTTVASKLYLYCNIPLRYYKMMQFKIIVSLIDGLTCEATTDEFQEPSFGEGQGKDIGWLEYESGGYKGKPGDYRVGEMVGTAIGNFERFSTNAGIYNQVNITYSNESIAGWGDNKNQLNTVIAVPCTASNLVFNGILPILDAFVTGFFDPLDDDLAQCDCSTLLYTTNINDVTEDGLG